MTATDLTLRLTQLLQRPRVVIWCVEFCGPGLVVLALADRATIANMAPMSARDDGLLPGR
ncbi:MAG: hypothetical protein IPG96_20415 [Proteobacteria bacterium]|nr:hypothetical protein [Pseudomonadota bacterium]